MSSESDDLLNLTLKNSFQRLIFRSLNLYSLTDSKYMSFQFNTTSRIYYGLYSELLSFDHFGTIGKHADNFSIAYTRLLSALAKYTS